MPAIPPEEFLKPAKTRRQIKGKQFKGHVLHNIIDRHIINKNRGFIVENCKTATQKIILRENSDRVESSEYRDSPCKDS